MEKELVYNVEWNANHYDVENVHNGIYSLREVIKKVVYYLIDYCDEEWEEKLWENGKTESGIIEHILELKVGEKFYIPYASEMDNFPDVVCITAIEKEE